MGKEAVQFGHTVVCVEQLILKPNKFKHLGAEIEAGIALKDKDWTYYSGNIKAGIASAERSDFSRAPPEVLALIETLRAEARAFVVSVAKCEIHPEDWEIVMRSSDATDNRFWLTPSSVWTAGTLAVKQAVSRG